jgi:BirA family biotin operon repressor/biotin-[acetyl-CoA-carboxylase] ligase
MPTSPSLNIPLLNRLKGAGAASIPVAELAAALGESLERVQADLDALESFGFAIERHPIFGVSYRGPAERLCPDQIEYELDTLAIGRRIAVWSRATSTNDLAARAGASPANDGLVVLAEEQTAGRGRRGRAWASPPRRSILMSVVIFPPDSLMPASGEARSGPVWLTALGAVAVTEVVAELTGCKPQIKWPNDVRVDRRKLAGILVERVAPAVIPVSGMATSIATAASTSPNSQPQSESPFPDPGAAAKATSPRPGPGLPRAGVVIGIGLNANLRADAFPDELRNTATSLQILAGGYPVDRSDVVRLLVRRLDAWYERGRRDGPAGLGKAWRERSEHLGAIVTVDVPGRSVAGRLVDLDLECGLTLASLDHSGPREIRISLADVLDLRS